MRAHTPFYATAILALATFFGCGSSEQQKFPCKTGEVLTAVGVCAAPTDLVPKEKTCATGMLQQSDGTCVPPANPDEPWVFPCAEGDLLHEDGSCTSPWTFPCAVGNVLQSDGSCTALGDEELSRIAATSRVYVTPNTTERYEYVPSEFSNGVGTGGFVFHAVGEDFLITKVAFGLTGLGLGGAYPNWISSTFVYYTDEGGTVRRSYIDGQPNTDAQVDTQIFVKKGESNGISTGFAGDTNVCRNATGFEGWTSSLILSRTEAVGLTTGKRVLLSEAAFETIPSSQFVLCGTGPDPRATP